MNWVFVWSLLNLGRKSKLYCVIFIIVLTFSASAAEPAIQRIIALRLFSLVGIVWISLPLLAVSCYIFWTCVFCVFLKCFLFFNIWHTNANLNASGLAKKITANVWGKVTQSSEICRLCRFLVFKNLSSKCCLKTLKCGAFKVKLCSEKSGL